MRDRGPFSIALPTALLAACLLAPPAGPHSSVPPGTTTSAEPRWACALSGSQALPPNSSLASGTCELSLRGGQIHAALTWRDLSGPVLQVEFHGPAAPGERGPLLWAFAPAARGPRTSGPVECAFDVSHAEQDLLREGRVYVDVRTAIYPGGEIRGRLTEGAGD